MSDTTFEKHKNHEEEGENDRIESKRIKIEKKSDSLESDVCEFADWCRKMNIIINDKKVNFYRSFHLFEFENS